MLRDPIVLLLVNGDLVDWRSSDWMFNRVYFMCPISGRVGFPHPVSLRQQQFDAAPVFSLVSCG